MKYSKNYYFFIFLKFQYILLKVYSQLITLSQLTFALYLKKNYLGKCNLGKFEFGNVI